MHQPHTCHSGKETRLRWNYKEKEISLQFWFHKNLKPALSLRWNGIYIRLAGNKKWQEKTDFQQSIDWQVFSSVC